MAAFSSTYQHSPLVLDSLFVPNKLSSLLEDNTIRHTTFLSPLCTGDDYLHEIPVPLQFHEITSPHLIDTTSSAISNHVFFTSTTTTTDPCMNVRHTQLDSSSSSSSSSSSTMVANDQQLESGGGDDQLASLVRKRSEKIKELSKVAKEGKGGRRKEKRSNAIMLKNKVEKKLKVADHSKAKKKVIDEVPTGYIHVRARRGQATDSHSLAERVRREKISERMRLLQSIVPGCDKITGKAQILDEIINYVQSLQFQVEFLIGKLASVSPMMLNHFELDFDTNALLSEKLCSLETPVPSMIQSSSSIQLSPLAEPKSNPIYFLPQQEQKSNIISQDNQIPLWEINDQRLKFMNQEDEHFSNLSPFF